MMLGLVMAAALSGCLATDGDSIRCGKERIRLVGIDAPEMGRCPPQRKCAQGDPVAARDNLARAIAGRTIRVERIKQDRYGRTVAAVSVSAGNLSCIQLGRGHAVYRRDWDDGLRIARTCPGSIRR